ncbi:MAG: hydroxymethylglutaryl-CoA reductase [Planctomycetota bacterium]|jgi:hydroxymethylglutaryl-CoA reductase (NADPH)
MPTDREKASCFLSLLLQRHSLDELQRRIEPKLADPAKRVPRGLDTSPKRIKRRWALLNQPAEVRDAILDPEAMESAGQYDRNIENYIGTVKVPVGIAGPLRVNGCFAQGDYYVPLATTEAALVASYSRGAQLVSEVGGCSTILLTEGVSRAPGFAFRDLNEAGRFVAWALTQEEAFNAAAASTTNHGLLHNMSVTIEGNHVYLCFDYRTGDAAGQNMVTIATAAICDYIREHSPVSVEYSFVEANLSGDKKASGQSFMGVRGKKVTAEVRVPAALVERRLGATAARMGEFWRMTAVGGSLSGTLGVQGHYANALAAIYIACGQDAACVAESAVGMTRLEVTSDGDLYAAVTLPNIMVGTVGGGTGLPSQQACLRVLGCKGNGGAQAFAEVCAGIALAGELSITGALCAHSFASAHQRLARKSRSDRSGTATHG